MYRYLKKIKHFVFEILYPTPPLPADLLIYETLFCPVCKARQARNIKICHKYSQYKLGAATAYSNDVIRKLIWQLKYRGKTGNALILGNLLIRYLETCNLKLETFIIVPIPLSKKRLRRRGYNQANLIARLVAEHFGLLIEERALVRQKDAKPQMEIKDWDERKKNVFNCFGVTRPDLIKGRSILLIDDVFTSGATMNDAAHALKDFGAKQIIGLVIAKAG